MVVNDNAVNLTPTCALRFIASKLAPTSNEYARYIATAAPALKTGADSGTTKTITVRDTGMSENVQTLEAVRSAVVFQHLLKFFQRR